VALVFQPSTPFRSELEARVGEYFTQTGLSTRDAPRMYLKTAVLFGWLAVSYLALLFWAQSWWQVVPLAISLGLSMAGIGFNVQHDGGHGAYSSRRWVNRVMALSLNFLGGSAYFWHFKHNIAHHTYPNISGSDDDISLGWFGRLSPHDRHHRFHRFQHIYVWGLYAMLVIEWQLTNDFRSMVKPGVASTHVPRPRGGEQVIFWVSKAVFFTLAFVIPMLLHPVGTVIAVYLLTGVVLGLTLATVFQLAHCVEGAAFPMPAEGSRTIEREWAAHQVETSMDFARGSRFLTWYLGGLNFQIEHHLFPKICHVHYPALSPIVEKVCQEHGVRHFSHPTMWSAIRSHVRWLRRMGRVPGSDGAHWVLSEPRAHG
jgi:linoleoyl-CoA desaturase